MEVPDAFFFFFFLAQPTNTLLSLQLFPPHTMLDVYRLLNHYLLCVVEPVVENKPLGAPFDVSIPADKVQSLYSSGFSLVLETLI